MALPYLLTLGGRTMRLWTFMEAPEGTPHLLLRVLILWAALGSLVGAASPTGPHPHPRVPWRRLACHPEPRSGRQ